MGISERIVDTLRGRILSGEWGEGGRLPSESELAKSFATSPCTVKKSLLALKREGLVHSRQGKGYFAQAAQARKWTVGVVVYELGQLGNPVMVQYMAGIKERLLAFKSNMIIYALNDAAPKPGAAAGAYKWNGILDPQALDGAIVLAQQADDRGLLELARHLPVAMTNRSPLTDRMVGVSADFAGGAFKAVSYLAEMGHRSIALLAVNPLYAIGNQQRTGARMAALEKDGLEIINLMAAAHSEAAGYAAAKEMLASKPRPTAIVAGSGELTIGAYKAIREAGLGVPTDLSVIDWSDTLSYSDIPITLTTVRMQFQKAGALCVDQLMELVEGKPVGGTELFLETELVMRESTRRI